MSEAEFSAQGPDPGSLRPLKRNELVRRGDFVKDERENFEPWVGPSGFRADAFIKQVFRRRDRNSAGPKSHREHSCHFLYYGN